MAGSRILSLLPCATEIVCALGAGDRLVGRSHECDFPPHVDRLPVASKPRIDITGGARAIDAGVRAIIEQGLSVYQVDRDRIAELAPDIILTQTLCAVCAVSPDDLAAIVCETLPSRPGIISLEAASLDGLWADIGRVAVALDRVAAGDALVAGLKSRLAALAATPRADRPRIACLEWLDPLMGAGNWVPELVVAAGGEPVFGRAGVHTATITWDNLAAADPDVILVAACGWSIDRSLAEMARVVDRPLWQGLGAVRAGRVYVADGHHYFNRPGPRLVESAEILAEILHSGPADPRHRGSGWEPFSRRRVC